MLKKQFTLYLANRPGELARITRVIARARINIEGISAFTSTDVGLVQIVVSNAAKTRATLQRAGVAFTVQDVVVVALPNTPGALADVTARIAESGANINYLYATACDGKRKGHSYAVISAPDLGRNRKFWSKA
ncbi:MAG: ACT domain-containing protein [Lentisphaerae bacterium]|nr:ACT domain-containing protein [Lentisphaerota bacterium]